MYHRVKKYRLASVDSEGKPFTMMQDFTEAQAQSMSDCLELDGLSIATAMRLVAKWNADSKRQGMDRVYSIPFVSKVE